MSFLLISILLDNLSSVKIFCVVLSKIRGMDIKFCENLKIARKDCNLTQKQVADKLNVVESCYANWEQGRTEPNVASLRQLSKILGVSIDELING